MYEGEYCDEHSSDAGGSQKQAPKRSPEVCPCRCCGKLLSGASNRRRHERKKHPQFVPGAVTLKCPTLPRCGLVASEPCIAGIVLSSAAAPATVATSARRPSVPLAVISDRKPKAETTKLVAMMYSERDVVVDSPMSMMSDTCSPVDGVDLSATPEVLDLTESDDEVQRPLPSSSSDSTPMEIDSGDSNDDASKGNQQPLAASADREPIRVEQTSDNGGREPKLVPEEVLKDVTAGFLHWLSMPPMTPIEAMVKARRAKEETQLKPIRHNLRFLFATLFEQGIVPALEDLKLELFQEIHICEALRAHLADRQVRGARIYALFLLIKKILVFIASERSIREKKYLPPTLIASFVYVDSICGDASEDRKRAAQNKHLLGAFSGSGGSGGQSALVPMSIGKRKRDTHEEESKEPSEGVVSTGSRLPTAAWDVSVPLSSAAASSAFSSQPLVMQEGSTLTKQEMSTIAAGCLGQLEAFHMAFEEAPSEAILRSMAQEYTAFLVTAILSLALAPRSQVLRELQVGRTLKKHSDGRYWAEMPAEMNKNRKPTMLTIPVELSPHLDFYLQHVRSAMLREAAASGISHSKLSHAYVFFKKTGEAPRPDFSGFTRSVTARLIGREVTAHAFRAGVITTYYEEGATQGQMDTLANLMAHDPSTARNYYYRPQFARAAAATNQEMASLLLHSPHAQSTKRIRAN